MTQADKDKWDQEVKDVDIEINDFTLKTVVLVFRVVAATAFISFSILMIGQFYQAAMSSLIGSTVPGVGLGFQQQGVEECVIQEKVRSVEVAHYESWTEFSENCCCLDRVSHLQLASNATSDTANAGEMEVWMCANQMQKERRRVDHRSRADGFAMRAFCSPTFEDGFMPAWNEDKMAFE